MISKSGIGIDIIGATAVNSTGKVNYNSLCIGEDNDIEGFKKLINTIIRNEALPGIQLNHAGRQTIFDVINDQPIAPSPIASEIFNETPKAMSIKDIDETILDFKNAAIRAVKIGVKIIEIHAAHGYLVHQFLSPLSNKRTDKYGGSFKNRIRFIHDIVYAIKNEVKNNIILMCRISATEYIRGGIDILDSINLCKELVSLGVDVIDVSSGIYGQRDKIYPTNKQYSSYRIKYANIIKQKVNCLVLCSGGILNLQEAEKILSQNNSDFIAIGRALLADPNLINKSISNQYDKIINCTWCNKCAYNWKEREHISCPQNPLLE